MSELERLFKELIHEENVSQDFVDRFIGCVVICFSEQVSPSQINSLVFDVLSEEISKIDSPEKEDIQESHFLDLLSVLIDRATLVPIDYRYSSYFGSVIIEMRSYNLQLVLKSTTIKVVDQQAKLKSQIAGFQEFNNDLEQKVSTVLEKQEQKIGDLIPQAIAAVGIFVAVITVIFGGLQISGISLDILSESPFSSALVLSFLGQLMFNCLFLLMFLLARLSRKPIHTICSNFNQINCEYIFTDKGKISTNEPLDPIYRVCMNCSYQHINKNDEAQNNEKDSLEYRQCGFFKKAVVRYPYFWIANLLLVILDAVLLSVVIINEFYYVVVHKELFVTSIIAIIAIFCFLLIYLIVSIGEIKTKQLSKLKSKLLSCRLNKKIAKESAKNQTSNSDKIEIIPIVRIKSKVYSYPNKIVILFSILLLLASIFLLLASISPYWYNTIPYQLWNK